MTRWAGSTLGNGAGALASAAGTLAVTAQRGLLIIGAGMSVKSAINKAGSGDYIGAALDVLQAGADLYSFSQSCFTGEMLLDVEDGKKRADEIQVGDRLWSRSEFDPDGPIELREVEEVFVRVAPIMNVHVAGQILRTTREHPFYVLGRGWIPAAMLGIGDLLMTRGGLVVPVEGVAESGAVETVYNWRVGEYHTYFVSAREHGPSVWAHNSYSTLPSGRRTGTHRGLNNAGIKDSHHIIQGAAVKKVKGYSRNGAPTAEVPGPSTEIGSDHYTACRVQDQAGGGTYAAERRIGYKALRRGGYSQEEARALIQKADNYFIGQLGMSMGTPLPIPGNRR